MEKINAARDARLHLVITTDPKTAKPKAPTAAQVRIYDNGGETADRYAAVYMQKPEHGGLFAARSMSENPFHPQGVGTYCAATPGRHLGKRIAFADLPEPCRRLVLSDLAD